MSNMPTPRRRLRDDPHFVTVSILVGVAVWISLACTIAAALHSQIRP
jgi:hypothetical protein